MCVILFFQGVPSLCRVRPLIRSNSRCFFCLVLWCPLIFSIKYVNSVHTLPHCQASDRVLLRHCGSSQEGTVTETGYSSPKEQATKSTIEITPAESTLVSPLLKKSTDQQISHSFSAVLAPASSFLKEVILWMNLISLNNYDLQ